jgi:hypothetical protein
MVEERGAHRIVFGDEPASPGIAHMSSMRPPHVPQKRSVGVTRLPHWSQNCRETGKDAVGDTGSGVAGLGTQ